jgi:hypothetical protein
MQVSTFKLSVSWFFKLNAKKEKAPQMRGFYDQRKANQVQQTTKVSPELHL